MILPKDITEQAITLSDGYMDLKGLSAYAAMSVGSLRDYIRSDALPCFKIKGKLLIKRSEFDQWIEKYRIHRSQDINRLVDRVMNDLSKE
ncbi:MAG: helix-turn-helix domain-containing protein [Deltaproteobacteria bacterium]|nr:helix-turn-helix domain-containing protein [Deltaproteobacteria bacterium]